MTHDERTPLSDGTRISLNNFLFTIRSVVGYGGSCIAYAAERHPDEYSRNAGMPFVPTVIKEFYPYAQRSGIERVGVELRATDKKAFGERRSRFEQGTANQVAFYAQDCNHSLPPAELACANGTVYSIVSLAQGSVLSEARDTLRPKEIADIIVSIRNAIERLHDDNKLYLDLKPQNIFLFKSDLGETRRIALFDFDTATPVNKIESAVILFSHRWSPYEQINRLRDIITYATDIYAIGAVLYWMYSGKLVTRDILDGVARGKFDFLDEIPFLRNSPRLREKLEKVLFSTLRRTPNMRAQRVDDIPL